MYVFKAPCISGMSEKGMTLATADLKCTDEELQSLEEAQSDARAFETSSGGAVATSIAAATAAIVAIAALVC